MRPKEAPADVKGKGYYAEPWEETPKKKKRLLPILCGVLAVCTVFLSCVCLYYVRVNGLLAQENISLSRRLREATQTDAPAETDRDRFIESRDSAWENAVEGKTYFVDSDGNYVYIPEAYRDNPQEWIDEVSK